MEQFKFILQNDLENILLYLSNGLFVFNFAIILIVNLIYKNSQKRICEMRGYSLLIFSTVFYYFIIHRFNSAIATLYLIIAAFVIFINYLGDVRIAIKNNAYTDGVCAFVLMIVLTFCLTLRLFAGVRILLLDWITGFVVMFCVLIDLYYLLYICNALVDGILYSSIFKELLIIFKKQNRIIKIIVMVIASPISIMKLLHKQLSSRLANKSLLDYLKKIVLLAAIVSFLLNYLFFAKIRGYTDMEINTFVVVVTAILLPLLL